MVATKEQRREYRKKNKDHISRYNKEYRLKNRDRIKTRMTSYRRKLGMVPMNENLSCASYLGVHVAERVINHTFRNVERMPYGNVGFDFYCAKEYKIDVKSSCEDRLGSWHYSIKKNTIADFFLLLAFDNRIDVTPLHGWVIDGNVLNHLQSTSISKNTITKWTEYKIDLTDILKCCDEMKGVINE